MPERSAGSLRPIVIEIHPRHADFATYVGAFAMLAVLVLHSGRPGAGHLPAPTGSARTLSAWSVSSSAVITAMIVLWGLLAAVTSPRTTLAAAGVLLLVTPAFPSRREKSPFNKIADA
ncbi:MULTISPECIES: hypothetical protein [unclassified Streptomyces]|uniref:hypothetical protein n=1 Tax=unclassified Streptomyces TaxID=2593676 RepID=UPI003393BE49